MISYLNAIFLILLRGMIKKHHFRFLGFAVLASLLVGSVFYHFVEGWSYFDALYFSVVTLTTVGYGDLSPMTMIGKTFTMFYLFIGIGIILSFITLIIWLIVSLF